MGQAGVTLAGRGTRRGGAGGRDGSRQDRAARTSKIWTLGAPQGEIDRTVRGRATWVYGQMYVGRGSMDWEGLRWCGNEKIAVGGVGQNDRGRAR